MTVEPLREAARLMRERAEAARSYYAAHHPRAGQEVPWFGEADLYDFDDGDGPHIIGMSPAVALAMADWLDTAGADLWAHGPLCGCESGCDECDDILWMQHVRRALAVARTYLGADQ